VWQKDVMENMQRWMDKQVNYHVLLTYLWLIASQAEATQLQIEAIRSEEARRRADLQAELQLMREQQAAELQRIQERQIEELQRVQERQVGHPSFNEYSRITTNIGRCRIGACSKRGTAEAGGKGACDTAKGVDRR
jgi:hypothetical protein